MKDNIYANIQKNLRGKGINVASCSIYDLIQLWKQWYRGNVDKFHLYTIKDAEGKIVNKERLTLNMAKLVSEDFAKLLWTEKTQINLDNKEKTKKMWEILDSKKNSFSVNFPIFLERVFALGTGMLIEYVDNDEIIIDYVDAECIIPYNYTNGYIYGVITVSRTTENATDDEKQYKNILTFHEYSNGVYSKYSQLFIAKDEKDLGEEVPFEEYYPNVENPVIIKTDVPLFQIIKPNIANNFDTDSPMGISIYANCIDKMIAADKEYDSFDKEFELGRKRVAVDQTALKATTSIQDGKVSQTRYLDTDDLVYVAIPGMEHQPIKEIDMSLRTQEHIDGINFQLNMLSIGLGFGTERYRFDGKGVKTATEVISENSETFRTREHHLIVVKDVVYDLVKSICFLAGIDTKEINIVSDDSIIEDNAKKKQEDIQEVNAGLKSKKRYLMENKGLSEQEAIEELNTIKEENKGNTFAEYDPGDDGE